MKSLKGEKVWIVSWEHDECMTLSAHSSKEKAEEQSKRLVRTLVNSRIVSGFFKDTVENLLHGIDDIVYWYNEEVEEEWVHVTETIIDKHEVEVGN